MEEEIKEYGYIAVRLIEFISIAAIIFGAAWEGTETFNLSMPQFCMLYGGIGAVVSEILARLLKKNIKKE
jgi:hypothetical protein